MSRAEETMRRAAPLGLAISLVALGGASCGSSDDGGTGSASGGASGSDARARASDDEASAPGVGAACARDGGACAGGGTARSSALDSGASSGTRGPSGASDSWPVDSGRANAVERDDAGPHADAAGALSDAGPASETCALPQTFRWTSGGPLAQPKNGWLAMKDFTHVFHDNQHIVYFTTYQTGWGSGMMTFKDWPDAAQAPQTKTSFGVAPTLFFFTPKQVWVLAYQWGPHKFSFRTSTDPTNPSAWSDEKSLYNTALPAGGTGPIDQTVICDAARCHLFYAGDNGHIYRSSLPIASFPSEFPAGQDSGIAGTAQNLFEAVQVYSLEGSSEYLMIVEAQGDGRYFRAFTAKNLDGPWTLLSDEFAVAKNVSFSASWTRDISHGDLVRSDASETFPVDPCKLQLVFQGRDPSAGGDYGSLPYRLGLLTLAR